MLTVQEIQAVNFEKAVFGGYDMKAVDEFLEHITEDFAALQKENAALKSKMKVLVDRSKIPQRRGWYAPGVGVCAEHRPGNLG